MKRIETGLGGVVIIEPRVFTDPRGAFLETWNQTRYAELGLPQTWVQDNLSYSMHGVLRGLHYQHPNAQGKLVHVTDGAVYDVAVDIRRASPTFGQWVGVELTAQNRRQVYIPPGFAHGFCVTSANATFVYKCTDFYDAGSEGGVRWDDPDIGIRWPLTQPLLSDKDRDAPFLRDIAAERLPPLR